MLDNETKRRIDTARDILVGKVPDPKSQVEQITIALIYKFMDDMDAEAEELGGKRKFFSGKFSKFSWQKLMSPKLGGFDVLNLYAEAIQQMNYNDNIPQLFRDIFKNAYLPYKDPETLKSFLKIINEFEYDHSERLGDAFEYLLSVLGSQGDAGQFRTPRHIIDFMVYLMDPKKWETIIDPACGTAGFLISSYKHIVKTNSSNYKPVEKENFSFGNGNGLSCKGDKLTPDDRKKLAANIKGYDISPDMVRLSLVNLYLHGFNDPKIYEYDTLTSEDRWNDTADIIMANPPFMSPKGGIRPHKRFSVESNRSEVLFVDYIAEHLSPKGRAAVIVPEGIIFQSGKAYKALRKMLVDKYLIAVVSLPAGVFNPYSGVKTSILIMDKTLAQITDKILFAKIENDGFDLGAQRRANTKGELPDIAMAIKGYVESLNKGTKFNADGLPNLVIATKEKIAENDGWNLSGERYNERIDKVTKFITVELKEVCQVINGRAYKQEELLQQGKYKVLRVGNFFSNRGWYYSDLELEEDKYCANGDLLYAWSASFGPKIWDGDKTIFHYHIWKLIPDENRIDKNFLYHILDAETDSIKAQGGRGIAMMHITKEGMEKRIIPLPPLGVQKEIVAEIEGWQKIIDGARQVVENYKPQIEIDPEWPQLELGDVLELQRGYDLPKDKFLNGEYPVVGSNGIIGFHNQFKHPKPGVVTGRSGTIGKVHFINEDYWPHNTSLFVSDFKYNYPKFIFYLLQSVDLKSLGERTSAVPSLDRKNAYRLKVYLPPLQVQIEISKALDDEREIIEKNKELISKYEQKIKNKIAKVWGE